MNPEPLTASEQNRRNVQQILNAWDGEDMKDLIIEISQHAFDEGIRKKVEELENAL